ncbi:hypothetical protein PC9H_004926 [Pleurotus ostreatus]|uniref:Glucanase n=1 Tax=Pleurotus ostreatus TaxID=5322 RepID=A0A8H7DTV0_PLEOS|nr:uncharacterized protein PC9H_004926 [Pleurotus ostreatus]KAF7432982.1 hypothetical protein PC9H_004926 [Pleurotus ostreatus]
MFPKVALVAFSLAAAAFGQQVGTLTAETHPTLSVQQCTGTGGGSCSNLARSVVLDSNWRWLHTTSGSDNCYDGNTWDTSLCPDAKTCASNCALDGADYSGTYGITTSGNALTLKFVTNGPYSKNIGSRVYLLESESKYQMFNLKNQEFTFDIDMSQLPCGLNGALYFSEMPADGGMAQFSANKANVAGWEPSPNDSNAGKGQFGTCCSEMDIWEANNMAAAFTPHPCTVTGLTRCSGNDCGDGDNRAGGVCDKDGCDFNSFRMGDTSFLGKGKTVDTMKKFTVVTQFVTSDGTANGDLTEIRRVYVQDGKVIQNSKVNIPGMSSDMDSITTDFCSAQKTAFGDTNSFANKGGLRAMGDAFGRGMVLVMSVWDDHEAKMLWLDSDYPTDKSASTPGVARGECATTSGNPTDVESQNANSQVTFSNIRFGAIGSTFGAGASNPGSPPPTNTGSTSQPAPSSTAGAWGQCGGQGWTGPTACVSGYTCTVSNPYYSQCLPH